MCDSRGSVFYQVQQPCQGPPSVLGKSFFLANLQTKSARTYAMLEGEYIGSDKLLNVVLIWIVSLCYVNYGFPLCPTATTDGHHFRSNPIITPNGHPPHQQPPEERHIFHLGCIGHDHQKMSVGDSELPFWLLDRLFKRKLLLTYVKVQSSAQLSLATE